MPCRLLYIRTGHGCSDDRRYAVTLSNCFTEDSDNIAADTNLITHKP